MTDPRSPAHHVGFCGPEASPVLASGGFGAVGVSDADAKLQRAMEFHAEAVRIYRMTRLIALMSLGAVVLAVVS